MEKRKLLSRYQDGTFYLKNVYMNGFVSQADEVDKINSVIINMGIINVLTFFFLPDIILYIQKQHMNLYLFLVLD